MEGSQQPDAGFSPNVQEQLRQIAQTVPAPQTGRGRGQHRRRWDNQRPIHPFPHQGGRYPNQQQQFQQPAPQPWSQQMADPTDTSSFPPLVSVRPQAPQLPQQQYQQPPVQQPQHRSFPLQPQPFQNNQPLTDRPQPNHNVRRDFPNRGRGGNFRGRNYNNFPSDRPQPSPQGQPQLQNPDDFHRPAPTQRKLFMHGGQPQFNSLEEQRAFQHKIMTQSDFLNHLANQSLKNQLTTEEQQAKESFRNELEVIAQQVAAQARNDTMAFDPTHVQLKLYGSLGSGFGVAGSDMDLLLAFPRNEGSLGDIEIDSRRLLEKALLDAGFGARLLTNTRVPILRVCQKPSPELLRNLRDYRAKWEQNLCTEEPDPIDEGFGPLPVLTEQQTEAAAAAAALADLDIDAHEIPLPASPTSEQATLEYIGDCGIQCDINFSNYVALHNTRLLKTYGLSDPRVRQVGVFVKSWAKARDINTPYRGTLSSYGYILMVLNYLMNVVKPPLIPNLQELAKQKDEWENKTEIALVEGFDVRFIRDMNEVQSIIQEMPRNHESVGSLLRGFFWYYADPRGFRWSQDVVSIRSRNGWLTKRQKGWTEAKWASENSNVRLRYLVAIEDPFELEHNVARTVGHNGMVAIKDEFRRAWAMIENIQFDSEAKLWYWLTIDGTKISGSDMIATFGSRGDLLRKDQNYHKQKLRQMKQDLEAKEKAVKAVATEEVESAEEVETNGTFYITSESIAQDPGPLDNSSTLTLMNDGTTQIENQQQMPSNPNPVQNDDNVWGDCNEATPAIKEEIDWDKPFTAEELGLSAEEFSLVNRGNESDGRNEIQVYGQDQDQATEQWMSFTITEDKPFEDHIDEAVPLEEPPPQEILEKPPVIEIAWTRQAVGGRWLCWRDRMIRSGTWKGTQNSKFQHLDQEFPYNPNMTVAELTFKNDVLRTLYLNTYHPIYPHNRCFGISRAVLNAFDETTGKVRDPNKPEPPSNPESSASIPPTVKSSIGYDNNCIADDDKSSTSKFQSTRGRHINRGSYAQNPRALRGNSRPYRSRNMTQTSNRKTSQVTQHSANSQQTQTAISDPSPYLRDRNSKPASVPQPPASQVSDSSVTQHKTKLLALLNRPTTTSTTTIDTTTETKIDISDNTDINTTQPEAPTQLDTQPQSQPQPQAQPTPTPNTTTQTLIPLTLHPTTPAHLRPRDEDPAIIPIPRRPNFQFDPRQLADMEIIRRGGNACAQRGEEFDIEVDYEWGGSGGMVMERLSSVGRRGGKRERKGEWVARGDQEGLLAVLPCGNASGSGIW